MSKGHLLYFVYYYFIGPSGARYFGHVGAVEAAVSQVEAAVSRVEALGDNDRAAAAEVSMRHLVASFLF